MPDLQNLNLNGIIRNSLNWNGIKDFLILAERHTANPHFAFSAKNKQDTSRTQPYAPPYCRGLTASAADPRPPTIIDYEQIPYTPQMRIGVRGAQNTSFWTVTGSVAAGTTLVRSLRIERINRKVISRFLTFLLKSPLFYLG